MVRQLDLKEQGINSIEEIPRYGFGIVPPGGDYKPSDIYFNHSALIKARYPNKVSGSEFVKIGAVIAGGDRVSNTPFTIKYTDDRPALWDLSKAKDIYVSGFFGNDFADSVTRVASIDTKEKTLTSVDGPTYPALADHKYFYFNLIEEIDLPGESYIDRDTMMLYFYPADDVDTCIMEIATFDKPFVTMTGASNITLKGINFDLSRDSAVNMTNSKNCVVDDAQISRLSYNAINIKAGTDCKVVNSHMFDLGCGAITVSGGDQITLTPGNNLFENNLFHRVNRVYASYRPAIVASGVGQKIINNEFYDSPHMVIKLEGNDMLIQYNKIHDVVREAADMAAIYWGRNPTWLGNQVVDNYFYDIGNPYGGYGQQSVFFDDGSVGAYVARNVFYKASSGKTGVNYAVKTYGGNFNTVEKNIFVENENAMCATSWTTSDGKQTGWYNWLQDLPPRASSGIKAKMEAVQFDKPGSAFWEAYPWFRTIISDGAPANGTNQFKGNLVVKGGYNVSTPNLTLSNNYKTNDDPGFKNYGSDFALTDQGLAFVQTKIPGFQNVEFDKMGLLTNIGGTAPVVSNAKVSAPVMTRVTVKAEYDFSDADGDKESVSLFQWYVSDTVDGTYTELANRTGKSLYIEDSLKDKYIKYQVTPVDNRLTKGEAVMSQPVLVTKNTTLSEAITLAQEFMNGLTAGSDLGQVPQSAKDALQAVITKALDVGEDASDQEIEKMIGELQRAMTDAQDAIIREVTMSENNKNITLVAKLEGQVINIPEAITDATITFPSDKLAYDVMVKGQVVIDGTVRDVTITIPKGTSSPDGNFTLFHVTNPSVTVPSAERAQTILFGDATFATPVRIQINGVAKQSVGYISNGKFYAVSAKVKEDSVSGASSVKPMGIVVDETDMIVWTKQLNELVLYTKTAVTPLPSPTSTSPSTGGGGNYGGENYVVNNGSGNPIGVGSQNDNDDQAQARFSDIVNHWARNDIEEMAAKGIVFGVDDNRFEPDRPVTRAEFAAIISRGLNISTGSGEFKDVASTDWFSQSVYAAANAGLIVGYDGYFRPDDLITREEMAVIIAKAYAYRGKTAGGGGVDKFIDKGDISQWAYGYVDAVTTEGLVFGKTVDTFVPKDIATRAETTSLIKRLLEK